MKRNESNAATVLTKTVLLSVKPTYAHLLVSGIKTIELRRRFPEDLKEGTRCIVYATSPVKKVIGECTIKKVHGLAIHSLWKKYGHDAMVSWADFSRYYENTDMGYALEITKPISYEKHIELNKIANEVISAPQSYRYIHGEMRI